MAVRDIWNRAEVFLRAGQFDEAGALYEQLAQEASTAAYASLRLGELAFGAGQLRAATRHVLSAYGAAQPEPSMLLQLCRQLLVVGEARAALAVAHALLQSGNATAAVLADLAKQMSDAMEPELALAALARAQQRGLPVNAGVAYLKGLNQLYMGELASAEASLRTSVEGLYAIGDVVSALNQISVAVGHAALAATDVHNRLPRNMRPPARSER